ncbi:MAG TPA: bacteriophage Gp15 family protein [Candidatus Mediterraneibacter excrementigallinarum]|nr:bacteriophage Gp15 family protein [Candidatus Mediterraneibacter excrementigallinarum]
MNFFYEAFPDSVYVYGEEVPIITDFREYIRLLDMLKCKELNTMQKTALLSQYFLEEIEVDEEAISALTSFVVMDLDSEKDSPEDEGIGDSGSKKNLFSYEIDYPFILSGFLRDYSIDLENTEYLHWWKFRMLFDGLSEDTEIKQRIMYRGVNLSDIKDKDERKRISRIQKKIQLPQEELTDYDIGNAFA